MKLEPGNFVHPVRKPRSGSDLADLTINLMKKLRMQSATNFILLNHNLFLHQLERDKIRYGNFYIDLIYIYISLLISKILGFRRLDPHQVPKTTDQAL